MSILAGSYERFLFGYAVQGAGNELKRSFTHAAHKGVVKCIAAAGQFAATGGADDLIHLYDLKNDKDLGFLMSPGEGAVTALAFFTPPGGYAPTHLLSGSADGSVSVWSAGGGWECMKTMRGHRKEVYGIAVHPSGLLGLSVSRDGFLRMWDLVKGRCTYTARLEAEAEAVHFCQEDGGARYALLCGTLLTLHSVGEAGTLRALAHPRRALCMAWAPGGRIVSGSEDGSLRLWDSQTGDELLCINRAHASRIRALALVPSSSSSNDGGEAAAGDEAPLLVATASSDGSVKLWDLSKAAAAAAGSSGGACLAEAQTRARLTCLATADLPAVMQRRLQAAAAARQRAAAAAAKQEPEQQQQQGDGAKKRKQAAGGAQAPRQQQAEEQQRPAKKKQKQREQQQGAAAPAQQQQQAGKGEPAKAGKPGKAGSKAAAASPAGEQGGVVVHDGVVEFLDSPEQQKKAKKKQQQVAAKRRAAAQHGKRPGMPGKRFQGGGGGGGGGGGRGGGKRK